MSRKTEKVYIIDPDSDVREGVATLLATWDIPVTSYAEAQEFIDSEAPQGWKSGCILVEAQLRGLSCLDFLRRLRAKGNTLPVLVLASTSNRAIADQALSAGATDVIDKPLINHDLLESLREFMGNLPLRDSASSH